MAQHKRARKFITITISITALICLTCWGYIRYQQYSSYQTLVPQNVSTLVRIDVYSIYKSMISEVFSYKHHRQKKHFSGITIPANIFCYTVKDKQQGTWFTSLPIDDIKQLEASLKEMAFLKTTGQISGITFANTNDGKWTIAFDKKHVAIAFSTVKETVTDVLSAILKQQGLIQVSASKFAPIKQEEGHITFSNGKDIGSMSFETGYIQADLYFSIEGIAIPHQIVHLQPDSTEAISMWLFAGFAPLLKGRTFDVDSFHISGDSILKTNPKGVDFSIGKPEVQRDSIVTYEYNDNFEKVSIATIQEHTVPGMYLWLHADYEPLENYLLTENIILRDKSFINKAVFPMYQLYIIPANYTMQFSTVKYTIRKLPLINSTDFFGLTINFEQLQQQAPFAVLHPYIKQLKQLQAKGTKYGTNGFTIKAKLTMKNDTRSALAQLLEQL